MFFKFQIFGIIGLSYSSPLYDVYNVQNEPDAIPMHLLKGTLQIDVPSNNDVGGYGYRGDFSGRTNKRTRHGLPDSCCPTVIDVIEPTHGKNRAGKDNRNETRVIFFYCSAFLFPHFLYFILQAS